jgi:hypothetical protein
LQPIATSISAPPGDSSGPHVRRRRGGPARAAARPARLRSVCLMAERVSATPDRRFVSSRRWLSRVDAVLTLSCPRFSPWSSRYRPALSLTRLFDLPAVTPAEVAKRTTGHAKPGAGQLEPVAMRSCRAIVNESGSGRGARACSCPVGLRAAPRAVPAALRAAPRDVPAAVRVSPDAAPGELRVSSGAVPDQFPA